MGSMKAPCGKRMRDDLTEPCCTAGYNRRWGVTDQAYFLLFGSLHAGIGRLALMPLVVLASRICPKVHSAQQASSSVFHARTMQSPFHMTLPWCVMEFLDDLTCGARNRPRQIWVHPDSGRLNPENWHKAWC